MYVAEPPMGGVWGGEGGTDPPQVEGEADGKLHSHKMLQLQNLPEDTACFNASMLYNIIQSDIILCYIVQYNHY